MDEQKKTKGRKNTPLRKLWDQVGYLVVTALTVLLLFGVIFTLAYVPSGSMETTLPTYSFFIASRLPYTLGDPTPERGDIVMFHSVELGDTLVKRVVGLPGDSLTFADGYVYLNGERLEEAYLPTQGITWPNMPDDVFTVPEDGVFVMGDHRDDSFDSRFWEEPFVPLSAIKGRALLDISFLPDASWKGVRLL